MTVHSIFKPFLVMTDLSGCRICLDETNRANLIRPCNCAGTQAWIHRGCLDRWRATDPNGNRFHQCEICHFKFEYEEVLESRWKTHRRTAQLWAYVAFDITALLIVINLVVLALTGIVYLSGLEKQAAIDMNTSNAAAALFIGWMGLFVILGLGGLLWACAQNRGDSGPCICFVCEDSGGSGEAGPIVCLFILVILAFFGVIIGLFLFGQYVTQVVRTRAAQSKLWVQTGQFVVLDRAQLMTGEQTV